MKTTRRFAFSFLLFFLISSIDLKAQSKAAILRANVAGTPVGLKCHVPQEWKVRQVNDWLEIESPHSNKFLRLSVTTYYSSPFASYHYLCSWGLKKIAKDVYDMSDIDIETVPIKMKSAKTASQFFHFLPSPQYKERFILNVAVVGSSFAYIGYNNVILLLNVETQQQQDIGNKEILDIIDSITILR